jgi:hypothetical protein
MNGLVVIVILIMTSSAAYAACCGISGTDNRVACSYYIAASGGNDRNPGTSTKPFATLSHLQSTLQGAGNKVGCLKGGTYYLANSLSFTTADNGETWETDPASAANAAVVDGQSTSGTTGTKPIAFAGVANFTWNAIKLQNCKGECVWTTTASREKHVTIENSEICCNTNDGSIGGFPYIIAIFNMTDSAVRHNYVHDCVSGCISIAAYSGGESIDGVIVDSNFVENCMTQVVDGGCLQFGMRATGYSLFQHVTISNNFARNYGFAGATSNGFRCIYLDDDTSNATVTGNICGPMTAGIGNTSTTITLINGGSNNIFKNNVFDIGTSALEGIHIADPCGGGSTISCSGPWGPNQFSNNIVVSNFARTWNGNFSGVPFVYAQFSSPARYDSTWMQISGNTYHNYGGGQEPTTGNLISDSSPIHADPGCTGYLYNLSSLPSGFTDVTAARHAGPPGFAIPTSTNHSC